MKRIFRGHTDLILGFNQFLPRGHEITVADIERDDEEAMDHGVRAKPQVEFVHAISYVNKIKSRFSNDERVYKNFLEILIPCHIIITHDMLIHRVQLINLFSKD